MKPKLNAALIGFGEVANGYSSDSLLRSRYQFITHSQVLQFHNDIHWMAVVDISVDFSKYELPVGCTAYRRVDEMGELSQEVDLVVLATPPRYRLSQLLPFSNSRTILVEKPLGTNSTELFEFSVEVKKADVLCQVNAWRRSDSFFRSLCDEGLLFELLGEVYHANVIYGNGLMNNGFHMIDFARMLFGEVSKVRIFGRHADFQTVLANDINLSFQLEMMVGMQVNFSAIDFAHYRENSFEIYGQKGLLRINNEGLNVEFIPVGASTSTSRENELCYQQHVEFPSTVGFALKNVYDNLVDVHKNNLSNSYLNSAIETVLSSEIIVHEMISDART